jgi:hypothetical protein
MVHVAAPTSRLPLPIWKGNAELRVFDHPYLELPDLRPTRVLAGYRFSCALTVDDLELLRDLREG